MILRGRRGAREPVRIINIFEWTKVIKVHNDGVKIHDWCQENCRGYWSWPTYYEFRFELEEDALLFVLSW